MEHENDKQPEAAAMPVTWEERHVRVCANTIMNLAEKMEAAGAGEQFQEIFRDFLKRNREEILTKSTGPARDLLLDIEGREERGFL